MIGETDELPTACGTVKYNFGNSTCGDVVNETMSANTVPYESRNFREVIKFGPNGKYTYSAGDGIFGCFDEAGEYVANDRYSIWVM